MDEFAAEVAERIGRRIRRRRRAIDMTQEELAFRAGVHRTQITLIERGRRQPGIETVVRLAGALDHALITPKPSTAAPRGRLKPLTAGLTHSHINRRLCRRMSPF